VSTVPDSQAIEDAALPPAHVDAGRGERLRDVFQILSPADLAALIGIDERTLAAWRSAHRGPDFVRLGRAIFYRRADVLAWVELNVTNTDRAN
jgi:predicted DNA-binding transcriptional regulator AlpA